MGFVLDASVMDIGFCAPVDLSQVLREIGYDFVEPQVLTYPLTDRESVAAASRAVAGSCLPTPVFSGFFPHDMRIVGPGVDEPLVRNYLARAAEFLNAAGARVAVMGSAWSRNVPRGWERSRAEQQLLAAYCLAADAFADSGVIIGIEPQCRKEANIITTVSEAVEYAGR
jgi:sugar phosphate isomerase/epimerase